MHVGFVGTGNMGLPMALNVLKAGHRLSVYDRRPEATVELERLGAARAADLPSLAREVRVTLLSLPDDRTVEAVLFGDAPGTGLVDGAREGDVVFDLSTVGPGTTRRLAERATTHGVRLIDAPVSGSVSGARAATLAIMVGASEDVAKPYEPVLRAMGASVFYLGHLGRGNTLKLLNNLVALTNQAVLCEAMALADRLDVPREVVGQVLGKSSGGSFILERKLAALYAHDYSPGSSWTSHSRTCAGPRAGRGGGARLTLARQACGLYDEASAGGFGKLDSSGLLAMLESPRD